MKKYLLSILYLLVSQFGNCQNKDGFNIKLRSIDEVQCTYTIYEKPLLINEILETPENINLSNLPCVFQAILSYQDTFWHRKYLFRWSPDLAQKFPKIYGTRKKSSIVENYFEIEQKIQFQFDSTQYAIVQFSLYLKEIDSKSVGCYAFVKENNNWKKLTGTQFSGFKYSLMMIEPKILLNFLDQSKSDRVSNKLRKQLLRF